MAKRLEEIADRQVRLRPRTIKLLNWARRAKETRSDVIERAIHALRNKKLGADK
jgi:hypothetical protein